MNKVQELIGSIEEIGVTDKDNSNKETSIDENHSHSFEVDDDGNGKTTSTIGDSSDHVHSIVEFVVKSAGINDHIHTF